LKAQQYAHFLGDHEDVFSYDFIVPGIENFFFFGNTLGTVTAPSWWKVLQKANPPPPTNLKDLYFISFHVKLQGKEVLGRIILVLEKLLVFSPQFCIQPCSVIISE